MLLVTRPREQAHDWVLRLQACGVDAQALPLLGIHPAPDAQAVLHARQQLAFCKAVMFVSPNAVAGFQAAAPLPQPWPMHTLAVAPGPGTAAALQALGVPLSHIVQPPADAAQFDSESLWPELERHSWAGQQVWVVRGEGGRDWLIDRWKEAGAQVRTVAAYRRGAPLPTPAEQAVLHQALAQADRAVWLLSSSEALDHLLPLLQEHAPAIDLSLWVSRAQALATHPRILERALGLGLRRAQVCRADLASVVASYNRIHREP